MSESFPSAKVSFYCAFKCTDNFSVDVFGNTQKVNVDNKMFYLIWSFLSNIEGAHISVQKKSTRVSKLLGARATSFVDIPNMGRACM